MKQLNNKQREYMPFFRSFYESISDLQDKEVRLSLYEAIIKFGLTGIEPTNLKGIASTMWKLIRPNVANSRTQFENGLKGGAPKGNKNARRNNSITIPTKDDVVNYCENKGFDIDTERFFDYYEECKWQTQNYKIKTWEDAVSIWNNTKERNGYNG